jgi:flagellar biosynthetic protein FlhB
MAEGHEDSGEKTLDASPRKIEQARARGDVPVSREGSAAGVLAAGLLAVLLAGGLTARRVGELMLPLFERPDDFLNFTEDGWRQAGDAVVLALFVALAPILGLVFAGALVPYLLQNTIVVSSERLRPKLSNLSPLAGFKRIFSLRALFEFAKGLVKMLAVGLACYMVARPVWTRAANMVGLDPVALPPLLADDLASLLLATTLVAVVVAGIDVPYQHWNWRRRQRMSVQEMKEELRSTEGDPHMKARRRRMRRRRSQRRMMHDVQKATVVITNPTHYAVALRYRRGEDAAPVVVAKGTDLIALKIREVAARHNIALIQDPPLARALHAAVEIGETIPPVHFEAVAKIVGLIWARRAAPGGTGPLPGHAKPGAGRSHG